jgi:hypothetical protein
MEQIQGYINFQRLKKMEEIFSCLQGIQVDPECRGTNYTRSICYSRIW